MFLAKVPTPLQWSCSAGIVLCGLYLAGRDPVLALALLPSAVIIGPITRAVPGGLSITLGDAYVLLTSAVIGFRHGATRPIRLGRYHHSVFCGLFLIALSWIFSVDPRASAPTIVEILELLIVYSVTINVVRSRAEIQQLFDAWILAITLGSIVVVVSYLQRAVLILGETNERAAMRAA